MSALLLLVSSLAAQDTVRYGPGDVNTLPKAVTRVDENAGRLVIELPAVEVAAGGMQRTAVHRVEIPFAVSLYQFTVEVVDEAGRVLPADRLHHFNLTDPDRRELFAPLPLHIMAASKETPSPSVPRYLIGLPLPAGARYLAGAMVANPESVPRRLRPRLVFGFVRIGRVLPLIRAYPWVMDVKFPLGGEGGRKDFDLPPGKSAHFWESSPAVSGTIIGLGGHVHDYATAIELTNQSTGEVIWRQEPERDATGRVLRLPVGRFYRWYRLGVGIDASHTYRVTVYYDNPTGETIRYGGMGAVAGLFSPDRGEAWPAVDPTDPVYLRYVDNLLKNMQGMAMGHGGHQPGGHGHHTP